MANSNSSSPLKKFFKFVLIAGGLFVGLIVLLLVAAAIIIPIKFPPAKLKAMAEEKLTDSLHHKVTVGDVHFNVLSGFKITNLKISNRQGWDARPLISTKDISISYDLFPLLWGQVSLGEVRLNEPDILIERRGLDQFNFSDMMGDAAQAAPAPAVAKPTPKAKGKAKPKSKKKTKKHAALLVSVEKPAFSSFFVESAWAGTAPAAGSSSGPIKSFTIGSVKILHGKLVYMDETVSPQQESDLKDLNLEVNNISMTGGKSNFSLDTPFTYNKTPYKLEIGGGFRYFQSSQSLKEVDIKGDVNGLGFKVSGDALNMSTDFAPNMDGEASLNMLKFSGLVPQSLSKMPSGLSLTGPANVDFHLSGSLKSGLELKGSADGSSLAIAYKDLFVKTDKTNCKVDFTSVIGHDGSYDLPSFKAIYDNWEVTGAFHHRTGSPWSCEVHSKTLPFQGLPGMLPKLKGTTIDGSGSLDLKILQSKGPIPYMINGQVALKGVGITLPKAEPYLQKMTGTFYCANNVIRLPSMTFDSFDGTGAMGMTLNGNTMVYGYAFNLKNVNAQKAIDASIDAYVTTKDLTSYKDKLSGTMNFLYSGAGRGTSGDQMMASQIGSGSYSLVNATIKNIPAIKILNSYFKDPSDELKFEKIDGNLVMKSSVFTFTANTMGKVGAIREKGGINVAQMVYSPDMGIQCDLKKDFVNSNAVKAALPGGLGGLVRDPSFLADDNGNIPVDLKFTGPVSENHYSWDTTRISAVVKKKAGAELQKAAKPIVQDLGNKAGNALKGLFGR